MWRPKDKGNWRTLLTTGQQAILTLWRLFRGMSTNDALGPSELEYSFVSWASIYYSDLQLISGIVPTREGELPEENFFLSFLCYGDVLFIESIKKFLQFNYKSGTQSPYADFNFLNTLRQYNPSNTLFSYFKALLSSGISFLQQVQNILDFILYNMWILLLKMNDVAKYCYVLRCTQSASLFLKVYVFSYNC